jgi:general secretion pathway protein B
VNAAVEAEEDAAAPANEPLLPSAAALAAEGVLLPALRLDLHAYSERRSDRFVFINGRKYSEGERLPEGVVLETVELRGAVLSYNGRRFLLFPE